LSQTFYENFVSMIFNFLVLLLIFVAASHFLFLYSFTQNMIYYYGYSVVLVVATVYGIKYFLAFKDFKENLHLFIPSEGGKREEAMEPLNLDVENLPLKVCLLYRNGMSLYVIQRKLGFSHPMQVKRKLIRGLDKLLKSYEEHEGKVEIVG